MSKMEEDKTELNLRLILASSFPDAVVSIVCVHKTMTGKTVVVYLNFELMMMFAY